MYGVDNSEPPRYRDECVVADSGCSRAFYAAFENAFTRRHNASTDRRYARHQRFYEHYASMTFARYCLQRQGASRLNARRCVATRRGADLQRFFRALFFQYTLRLDACYTCLSRPSAPFETPPQEFETPAYSRHIGEGRLPSPLRQVYRGQRAPRVRWLPTLGSSADRAPPRHRYHALCRSGRPHSPRDEAAPLKQAGRNLRMRLYGEESPATAFGGAGRHEEIGDRR